MQAAPPPSEEVRQADVALDVPGQGAFTYRVPDGLAAVEPGDCVTVPLGPRRVRGFVIATGRRPPPAFALRDIIDRRPDVRLPPHLLALISWGARYYRCSLGEFLAGAVPAAVREGRAMEREVLVARVPGWDGKATPKQRAAWAALPDDPVPMAEALAAAGCSRGVLDRLAAAGAVVISERSAVQEVAVPAAPERHQPTAEQVEAIAAVAAAMAAGEGAAWLLHGITGSGKTLVYLELAERAIAAGRQVLLLLPEIALTPQLATRVRSRVPRTVVWHSAFTEGERAELWRQVAGGGADLVLGTRSALFAPLPRPGLIVVDEEHEQSYKQDTVPRYHARDLAVVYARQLGIPCLLGSATPALESVLNARQGRYRVLRLRARPAGGALPRPELVDMRAECQALGRAASLSRALITRLAAARAAGEQAIVLLNRRGWSPVITCAACGFTCECSSCAVTLTWHRGANELRCHLCGHRAPLPPACPACGGPLRHLGLGTERLAHELVEAVPGLRVLRVDADTTSGRQGHARLLATFAAGEADCLVGTQMVAKGLDFPGVTVVGVLCADKALAAPDFRSAERTYQLVAQVSGRSGRGRRPGSVVVQAYDTGHPAIACALTNRAKEFYDGELDLRARYGYPPSGGLVRILWSGPDPVRVQAAAEAGAARLQQAAGPGLTVLGPAEAALALLKGQHRWHCLLKSPSRGAAQAALDRLDAAGGLPRTQGVRTAIDVDPYLAS